MQCPGIACMLSQCVYLWYWCFIDGALNLPGQMDGFPILMKHRAGNTKGGSIIVPLTSCLTCLDCPVLEIKTKNFQLSVVIQLIPNQSGQLFSDTYPFSIPCIEIIVHIQRERENMHVLPGQCMHWIIWYGFNQGILTEGEGSVRLNSLY